MTNTINTIKIALESYDKNKITFGTTFKKTNKIKMMLVYNDVDINKIEIMRDDKILYNGSFELVGTLQLLDDSKVWSWSWNIPGLHKSINKKVRSLLDYGINKIDDSKNEVLGLIKQYLINGNLMLANNIEKELLLAIISYLTKSKIILELKISVDEYNKLKSLIETKKNNITLNISYKSKENYYSIFIII